MKLELGGGPNVKPGYISIDALPWSGVTAITHDLTDTPWPIESDSVTEMYSCHCMEHLTWQAWVGGRLTNEMYRVMAPGATMMHIWPEPVRIMTLAQWSCDCVDFKTFRSNPDCPRCGGHGRINPLRIKTDLCGDQARDLPDTDIHKNVIFESEFIAYVKRSGFVDIETHTHPWNLSSCVLTARKPYDTQ